VPLAVPSQAAVVASDPPPSPISTSSDTIPTAPVAPIAVPTSLAASSSTQAPAVSQAPISEETSAQLPTQADTDALPTVTDTPAEEQSTGLVLNPTPSGDLTSSIATQTALGEKQPQSTNSILDATLSGDSAGIIATQPASGDSSPLTLPNDGARIGGIVGGVIGGVAILVLIGGLLLFCLKRKSRRERWDEKSQTGPRFMEKIKSIPAGVAVFFAKIKGDQASPANPYQGHTVQTSVGSVYSTDTNGRARSTSEPQAMFAGKRAGSTRSTSSKKSERNLLRKKPSSIPSTYRFPVISEGTASPNRGNVNPFADPDPANTLLLLNPDPHSAPVTPQVPAATADRASRNPFASVLDPPSDITWASGPVSGHQRNQSSMSALNPFQDPPNAPPVPTQAAVSTHTRNRSSVAYPAFDPTSTPASRESNFTFFGEPGPSRPATNMFTPGLSTGRRTVRQSDPFDLDRPEVLGFGDVTRKDVGGSVTRQVSRDKRSSSIGNWGHMDSGASRESAKPGFVFSWQQGGRR
jgi:hypothetical protein